MDPTPPMTTCRLIRTHAMLRRPPLRLLGHALSPASPTAGDIPANENVSDLCPALLDVQNFVEDLALLVGRALGDLEDFNRVEPELDGRYRRVLRLPDGEGFLLDRVLELMPINDETVAVHYYLGDAGFDVPNGALILHGQLIYDGSDRQNFHLTVDLGAAASADSQLCGSGEIRLQSRALEAGGQEIWCDFRAVTDGDGPAETSFAKYRLDAVGGAELEYVVVDRAEVSTVAAAWNISGGECAHRLELLDDPLGAIEYTTTRQWDECGVETSSVFGFTRRRDESLVRGWPRGSAARAIPAISDCPGWADPPRIRAPRASTVELSADSSTVANDTIVTGAFGARSPRDAIGEEPGETTRWHRDEAAQTWIFDRVLAGS